MLVERCQAAQKYNTEYQQGHFPPKIIDFVDFFFSEFFCFLTKTKWPSHKEDSEFLPNDPRIPLWHTWKNGNFPFSSIISFFCFLTKSLLRSTNCLNTKYEPKMELFSFVRFFSFSVFSLWCDKRRIENNSWVWKMDNSPGYSGRGGIGKKYPKRQGRRGMYWPWN